MGTCEHPGRYVVLVRILEQDWKFLGSACSYSVAKHESTQLFNTYSDAVGLLGYHAANLPLDP